jgi:hypothetical protein
MRDIIKLGEPISKSEETIFCHEDQRHCEYAKVTLQKQLDDPYYTFFAMPSFNHVYDEIGKKETTDSLLKGRMKDT